MVNKAQNYLSVVKFLVMYEHLRCEQSEVRGCSSVRSLTVTDYKECCNEPFASFPGVWLLEASRIFSSFPVG